MKSAALQHSGVLTQEERHQSDLREANVAHQSQKGFNSIAKQTPSLYIVVQRKRLSTGEKH